MADVGSFIVRGDDGAEYGPVESAELREWVRENRVGLGTPVRRDEPGAPWQSWQSHAELVALLAEVRATGRMLPPLPSAVPVLAPLGRRVAAFLLDFVLSFIPLAAIFLTLYWFLPPALLVRVGVYSDAVLKGLDPAPLQVQVPAWFQLTVNLLVIFVPILYYGGFHAAHGRTPAKSILRLRVVDERGLKPRPLKAFLRAFVFFVCVYFFYCIPLFYAFFNPQRRALHDLVAGTYVVEW